jgi:hypothetical protein
MTDHPEPAAWTPPPPGDRREQLPDHILALIDIPPYTSTACESAELCGAAIARRPEHADELRQWEQRQRQRCRINNKYTGVNCRHTEPDAADPDDHAGVWTPDPPIGCLNLTAERTPSQRLGLHALLADAIRTAACDGDCGKAEEECAREHIQPIVLHHDRIAEVSGSPDMFADVVLALLYREWPWLRAGAEDAVPPPGS